MAQQKHTKAFYSRPRLVSPIGDYLIFDTANHLEIKIYLGKVHAFVGILRGVETNPNWKDIKFSIEHVAVVNMNDTIAQPMAYDVLTHIFPWQDKAKAECAVHRTLADGIPRVIWFEARGWPKSIGWVRNVTISRDSGDKYYDQTYLRSPPWLARLSEDGPTMLAGPTPNRQQEPPQARYIVPPETGGLVMTGSRYKPQNAYRCHRYDPDAGDGPELVEPEGPKGGLPPRRA